MSSPIAVASEPLALARAHAFWRGSALRLLALMVACLLWGVLGTRPVAAATHAVTWPPIHLTLVEDGFDGPIGVVSANDGTDRLFVVERGGHIYIIENGERLPTAFLDISDRISDINAPGCGECGLLGLAFPPDFADQGYFYVDYTSGTDRIGPETGDPDPADMGDTVIARFHLTADPNVADPDSEEPVLVTNQPDQNHNGGQLIFGPDGYLYIGMGDGGGGGDDYENAQDPASLLGKILRIDVSTSVTYTIPATNPFTDTVGFRDEIWAWGLRNPWRFHFDRITGDLYLADVGQGTYEEINHIAAAALNGGGMNFGWPVLEGDVCYPPNGAQDCDRDGYITPVTTYDHDAGDCSVTGGYVYRTGSSSQPPVYLYADYCTGRLWGLQPDGADWATTLLDDLPFKVTSFGDDAAGNVYIVSYAGAIYRVDTPLAGLQAENDGPKQVGAPINFTATITAGSNVTFTWDFGDGSGSNDSDISGTATHTYTMAGVYTATVVATAMTSTLTATTTVYVGDVVVDVINNEYVPSDIVVPPGGKVVWVLREGNHSVTADDGSFNQPAGTDWPPFMHEFPAAESAALDFTQVYTYHCTIHGGPGGVGMYATVTVTDEPIPPITGLAAANSGPTELGTATHFTATVTGGVGISYAWDFGDGSSGSSIHPSHTYTQAGVYTATVTATNITSTMIATTTAYVGDAVVDVVDNAFLPQHVTVPPGGTVVWVLREGDHSVTADDGSFNQPAGPNWPPFVHTFAPVQNAELTATQVYTYHCTNHGGPGGIGMYGTVTVEEGPPPVTGLTAANDGPTLVNAAVHLTATVTGGMAISYTWDFGDGSEGSGITTSHSYAAAGIYTATVVASNATNSMTATTTVYIGDAVVDVVDNAFLPRDVTVPVGGTVVWVLRGGTHSVTADDGSFNQPAGSNWTPFVHTFNTANVYLYHCSIHGAPNGIGMSGSVTVVNGSGAKEETYLPNIRLNAK